MERKYLQTSQKDEQETICPILPSHQTRQRPFQEGQWRWMQQQRAAFDRETSHYRTEIPDLRAQGIVYGRPHPAVTRTLQYAADIASCRTGQHLSSPTSTMAATLALGAYQLAAAHVDSCPLSLTSEASQVGMSQSLSTVGSAA